MNVYRYIPFFIFTLLLFNSCSDDSQNDVNQQLELVDFRKTFISKDFFRQKEEFLNLSESEKSRLWVSKLNQVKSNDLPKEHMELLSRLIILLEDNSYDNLSTNEEFIYISKRFFEITPFSDLNNIFSNLEDYTFRGGFDEKSGFIEFENDFQTKSKTKASLMFFALPDCNCSWTCASECNPYCTTKNCNETSTGCGFLWLQSCKKKAIL